MNKYQSYPYSDSEVQQRLSTIKNENLACCSEADALRFILNSIDLTTLEGNDNEIKIENLCLKALSFISKEKQTEGTAAVCVYPVFVAQAKQLLKSSALKVACVAGAFPSGQSPLAVKLQEVQYAVNEGADEVDMVISRGKFLAGNYEEVFDEIAAIKQICKDITLKVILETGELITHENIYIASQLAIAAGADFIKTSTGKIAINATPESFIVMCDAIQNHYKSTGKIVGIKAAGGIADAPTALFFLKILETVLGKPWLTNTHFRIGASRLVDKIML